MKGILENILLVREEYEEKEGCLEDDREGSGVCEGSDIWMEEMKVLFKGSARNVLWMVGAIDAACKGFDYWARDSG